MKWNSIKHSVSVFFWLSCLFLCTSCGQLTSLQTAKVTPEDTYTIGGAVMGYGAAGDENVGSGDLGNGVYPHVELFGRYGLSPNFDMGLKVSSSGNLLIDGKYQFVGDASSTFALAIGAGFELQASNFSEVFVYRLHLPFYMSIHPNDDLAIYATPRFALQSVSNDETFYFPGGSVGLTYDFSERFTGLIEGSYYLPYSGERNDFEDNQLYLFGVGGKFHFGR